MRETDSDSEGDGAGGDETRGCMQLALTLTPSLALTPSLSLTPTQGSTSRAVACSYYAA